MITNDVVQKIVDEFGTLDVFEIAGKAGVRIVYESWFPVTIGEFDRRNKAISVNLNAAVSREKIIAHELGHFFWEKYNLNQIEEEKFAREFAEIMIG